MLEAEPGRFPSAQKRRGRELPQERCRQAERQTGVAAGDRMTDLVPLAGVEEQYMIGVGDDLVASDVPQVHPAIGKYKVRRRGAFLYAAMTTFAGAAHVAQRNRVGAEQADDIELGCSRHERQSIPLVAR